MAARLDRSRKRVIEGDDCRFVGWCVRRRRRIKEIDELQLENGALSVRGQAAGDSENGRFSKGRIKDLVRKLGRELLRETEHATFWIFNVLAEENSSRIFLQARAQGFVHRIANPIFPGRQDFFVDL